jgi:hypothetical protein
VVTGTIGSGCGASKAAAPRRNPDPASGAGGECVDCEGEGGAPGAGGVSGFGGDLSNSGSSAGPSTQGGTGEAGSPAAPPPELTLRSIVLYQSLELPLMQSGARVASDARPVPLIAGKRALVRAFVDLDERYVARRLLGVLDVSTGATTRSLVSERTLVQASAQDDLESTFTFEVEGRDLTPSSSYRLRVLEADTTPLVRFPETGYLPLEPRALPPLRVVLVPFVSGGFAPRTTEAELGAIKKRLFALYPSLDVSVDLTEPVTLKVPVSPQDDGWDEALDEIYRLRSAAKASHDAFYYGWMAPAASFDEYCVSGCTLGLSNLADADDVSSRGSIGVGVFQDGSGEEDAFDTVAHELGHALGRDHSPCGIDDPSDVDPDWPDDTAHRNGSIGLYGFDFDSARLLKPRPSKDVMGYCTPMWVSDYTYRGLFERLDYIASESFQAIALVPAVTYRVARVHRSGASLWLGERQHRGAHGTERLELLDAADRPVARIEVRVVRQDHAPGAYVWLPLAELGRSGAVSVDLRPLGGSVLRL